MTNRLLLFCLGLSSLLLGAFLSRSGLPDPVQASPAVLQQIDTPSVEPSLLLGLDRQLAEQASRQNLVAAIDQSLHYLQSSPASAAYQHYPIAGITRSRVLRSLMRFRQLVLAARSPEDLQVSVRREFDFYQSIGRDGLGTVDFTGYFEPTYAASLTPTAAYRYPLYRLPPNLSQWAYPQPTRLQLEGEDGLQGSQGLLRGLELVWLRDRLEAFLVQVQGSARLQLTDGSVMTVGVAGHTDHDYTGIGRQLVADGKLTEEALTLPNLLEYFRQRPQDLNLYLPRNHRFVFFRSTAGAPAIGSLGVPVTAERSIATDRALMPAGALALIQTNLPIANSQGELESRLTSRYMLDQDTGGAIRGAGRVDIFMGTGTVAGDRAGLVNTTGQLYYLLLKD
jgi:membrane-bound lytic murein transglycosylase A